MFPRLNYLSLNFCFLWLHLQLGWFVLKRDDLGFYGLVWWSIFLDHGFDDAIALRADVLGHVEDELVVEEGPQLRQSYGSRLLEVAAHAFNEEDLL